MDKKQVYCRYCGKLIDEDALFCTYCGKEPRTRHVRQNRAQVFSQIEENELD